jgi:hypothetical protein
VWRMVCGGEAPGVSRVTLTPMPKTLRPQPPPKTQRSYAAGSHYGCQQGVLHTRAARQLGWRPTAGVRYQEHAGKIHLHSRQEGTLISHVTHSRPLWLPPRMGSPVGLPEFSSHRIRSTVPGTSIDSQFQISSTEGAARLLVAPRGCTTSRPSLPPSIRTTGTCRTTATRCTRFDRIEYIHVDRRRCGCEDGKECRPELHCDPARGLAPSGHPPHALQAHPAQQQGD